MLHDVIDRVAKCRHANRRSLRIGGRQGDDPLYVRIEVPQSHSIRACSRVPRVLGPDRLSEGPPYAGPEQHTSPNGLHASSHGRVGLLQAEAHLITS